MPDDEPTLPSSPPHLDRLYTVARVLTGTSDHAAQLVRRTYQETRAADALDVTTAADLLRAMVRLHAQGYPHPQDDEQKQSPLQDIRSRSAEEAVRRALPLAFATQSHRDRVLLTLCDVEGLDIEEAADVLDLSAGATRRQLSDARDSLHAALRTELSAAERRLVDDALSEADIRAALQTYTTKALGTAPPSLRSEARSALMSDPAPSSAIDSDTTDSDTSSESSDAPSEDAPSEDAPSEDAATTGYRVERAPAEASSAEQATAAEAEDEVSGQRLQRVLLSVLLVGLLIGGGYLATQFVSTPPESPDDLAALSLQHADDISIALNTDDPGEAAQFIRDEVGIELPPPSLEGATLRGVTLARLTPEVRAPVYMMEDAESGQAIAVFAFTYALLDRYGDVVGLDRDIRTQLEDEGTVYEHATGQNTALLWRQRNRIYLAATQMDADELSARLGASSVSNS